MNKSYGLNERLMEIYGEDALKLQTLYEKYVTRESWSVRDEALWLISGIDPSCRHEIDDETQHGINSLWQHARHCAEQGLLDIVNPEQEPDSWRARPVDIYRWATVSRIELPEVFDNLMGFVASTVKPENRKTAATGQDAAVPDNTAYTFDRDREAVLGMALAILAAFPERCKSSSGRIKADKIIAMINEKQEFWLGGEKTSLSPVAMRDLINKWLMTVRS